MLTLDRLNALRLKLGWPAIPMPRNFHDALDDIDKQTGIITRHGRYNIYGDSAPSNEYVGARLARLERHVCGGAARNFFWLGAEG